MRALLLISVVGCAGDSTKDSGGAVDSAEPSSEAFLAPDLEGPHAAATFESSFTPGHGVELAVQAWYPTDAPGGAYRYDDVLQGVASDGGEPACDTPRPVVVFSHGNTGIRWQSVFLTERLATRGWVVVAPDHTYNTALDYDDARLGEVVFRRPVDVAATYDWLVDVAAAAGGPLEGCIDAAAGYAVIGHSFGGYTSLAVAGAVIDPATVLPYCDTTDDWLCDEVEQHFADNPVELTDLSDPRVWASVPMTPAGMGALAGGLDQIEVPLLMWGGGRDTITSMAYAVQPLFDGLAQTPRHLATVEDAGHYTFSDACTFLPTYDDCAPPFREPAEVHAIVNTMTAAFLDLHRGFDEASAWLPVEDAGLAWETHE
jgi:predicted dienelactone hydrolase